MGKTKVTSSDRKKDPPSPSEDLNNPTARERSIISTPDFQRILFMENPDAVYLMDSMGFFVDGNPMAEKITGYSKEELIGRHFLKAKLLPRSEIKKAMTFFSKILTRHQVIPEEFTIIRKDKSTINIELRVHQINIEGEKYLFGIAKDITEKVRILNDLKASEGRWKAIVTNSLPIIFTLDKSGIFLVSEGRSLSSLGLKPGEVVGQSALEIYKDIPDILKAIQDAFNGKTTNKQITVGPAIFDAFLSPMKDEKGHVVGVMGMAVDITEREKAKRAIEESEINYKLLFNQIADPIIIFDAKTHLFLDCNHSAISRYGYTMEEFRRMTPHDLHPPEDLGKVNKNIDDRSSSAPNEYIHVSKDGSQFNVETHTQEILYQGEEAWITIIRDITERKRFERELHEAIQKAEESDRLKSAFLANMSHEIRTPMNAILGFTELLDDPDLMPEEKAMFNKLINDNGERLLTLINDLIDISKIEAGQMRLNKEMIPLRPLLSKLHLMFSKEAKERRLEFTFINESSHENISIYTDRDRLNQILINLIKNALKFTPEGSITFGYELKKSSLEFFVRDTGLGVDSEFKEQIFNRFTQGEVTYSKKFEGTGLGLSITKAMVELLGGEIWLSSTLGEGSTFFFTHPAGLL